MSILVLPKRNIVIPSPDGRESVRLNKDVISQVPDWVSKLPYYKALVADNKLLVMTGGKKGGGRGKPDAPLGDALGGSDNGGSSIENPEGQ